MSLWLAIAGLAVINFLIKATGPTVLGDREIPPRVALIVHSMAPALIAGLLIVQILGQGWREFDWTQLPGLAVIAALWLLGKSQISCLVAGVLLTVIIRAVV